MDSSRGTTGHCSYLIQISCHADDMYHFAVNTDSRMLYTIGRVDVPRSMLITVSACT